MKKRKFAGGGMEDMTPEDVADMKMRERAGKAYDQAMPEPDTTFGKLRSRAGSKSGSLPPLKPPPGRYDSVRPEGFEQDVLADKLGAVKQGLRGLGKVGKGAALAAIPGGVLGADPHDMNRGAKMMRGAMDKYLSAADRQGAADREMDAQMRRETRGVEYKKGGSVSSASKRADGIAQRGKTRGTMVMCGGGYMKGKK